MEVTSGLDVNTLVNSAVKLAVTAAIPVVIGGAVKLIRMEQRLNAKITHLEKRVHKVDEFANDLKQIRDAQVAQGTRLAIIESMSPKINNIETAVNEFGAVSAKLDMFNELTLRRIESLEDALRSKH